jgi:hypothetical protein
MSMRSEVDTEANLGAKAREHGAAIIATWVPCRLW